MDWIIGLPPEFKTSRMFNAVLVFTDRATKMVHFAPTSKDYTSEETAQLFLHYIVKYHGLPVAFIMTVTPKLRRIFGKHFVPNST